GHGGRRRSGNPCRVRGDPGRAASGRQRDRHGLAQSVSPSVGAPAKPRRVAIRRQSPVKVEGTKHFEAPREKVWEVLNDPARLAKTMPGVQSFDVQDDKHWKANVVIPLGLGGLKMSINFEKTEERKPDYA